MASSDVEQVLLKHIREAVGRIPLHHLEIEMRLTTPLQPQQFKQLEGTLAGCTAWERTLDTNTCDVFQDNVRVTGAEAVCKTRIAVTDVDNGSIRVCTSAEEPVPIPLDSHGSFRREKQRRERHFQGWKLALTIVNKTTYEVEVELDNLWLVRQPPEVLAKTGVKLLLDARALMQT